MAVETLFIDASNVGAAEIAAWRELVDRAVEPNPFFEPEALLPAVRTLGQKGVQLLVARNGDGWIAMVPVRRQAHWRLVPMPALAVWRHPYCFLGTPLVARESVDAGVAALLDRALSTHLRFFALDTMGDGGAVGQAFERCFAERRLRPLVYRRYERASLQRRDEPTYLDETRSAHHRRETNRLRRKLERDLGGEARGIDRAGDPAAVEEFLRLEQAGWKAEAGTAMGADGGHTAFFRELCAGTAARGSLQLITLQVDDVAVGMQCNLRAGDTLFCFKIAHDQALSRYSPGIQVETEVVKFFHAEPTLMYVDSCAAPENMMINRLWPDRRLISTLVVPTRGPAGRVASMQGRVGAALEDRIRKRRATK